MKWEGFLFRFTLANRENFSTSALFTENFIQDWKIFFDLFPVLSEFTKQGIWVIKEILIYEFL